MLLGGNLLFVVDTRHHGRKQPSRRTQARRSRPRPTTQPPKKSEKKATRWIAPKSLQQAARQASKLHGEVESLTERAMNRAIRVGKVLNWAKKEHERQKSRGFVKWMEEKAGIPRRTGYNYMDLDDEEPTLRSRSEDLSGLLVTTELEQIKQRKRAAKKPKSPPKIPWPDSYTPHDSSNWFCTSRSEWNLDELKQASNMNWESIVEEDGMTGVRAQAIGPGTPYKDKFSIFSGVLMEWACLRYLGDPPARIIDPCAGGAVRGVVAATMGFEYHGIDISAEQIAENIERCEDMPHSEDMPHKPHYYVGDGTKLDDYVEGAFDLLITCPPYWIKEKYSGCHGDLSVCETYSEYLQRLDEMLRAAMPLLKSGAFACLVLGNVRDPSTEPPREDLDIAADLTPYFRAAGFRRHQSFPIISPNGSAAANAGALWTPHKYLFPVHQTMLVLRKP